MSREYDGTAIQMVPGTLRGYRAWRLGNPGWMLDPYFGLLRSITMDFRWDPRTKPRATCHHREPHPAPRLGCSCGYYALYEGPKSVRMFEEWGYLEHNSFAFGSIKAYGSIVLGTVGFRAEYMEIESLAGPVGGELAELYGAVRVTNAYDLLARFPPPDMTELIGVSNNG